MRTSEKGFIPPVPYPLEINTLVVEFELVRYREYVIKIAVHSVREDDFRKLWMKSQMGMDALGERKSKLHQQSIQQALGK